VLWIQGMTLKWLVLCRRELAVMPAVTAALLHHSAVDTGNDFKMVSTV